MKTSAGQASQINSTPSQIPLISEQPLIPSFTSKRVSSITLIAKTQTIYHPHSYSFLVSETLPVDNMIRPNISNANHWYPPNTMAPPNQGSVVPTSTRSPLPSEGAQIAQIGSTVGAMRTPSGNSLGRPCFMTFHVWWYDADTDIICGS